MPARLAVSGRRRERSVGARHRCRDRAGTDAGRAALGNGARSADRHYAHRRPAAPAERRQDPLPGRCHRLSRDPLRAHRFERPQLCHEPALAARRVAAACARWRAAVGGDHRAGGDLRRTVARCAAASRRGYGIGGAGSRGRCAAAGCGWRAGAAGAGGRPGARLEHAGSGHAGRTPLYLLHAGRQDSAGRNRVASRPWLLPRRNSATCSPLQEVGRGWATD